MKLLADISRCHGKDQDPLCLKCARKHQIDRDDKMTWYGYIDTKPIMGRCIHFIREEGYDTTTSP